MTYCSYSDINLYTNITSDDVSNNDLTSLIAEATVKLNHDIQIKVTREKIEYIDSTRENKIDGSNTNYYLKCWKDHYLGDSDNDGSVSTSDVVVHAIDSNGTETTATVSAVDSSNCKITLSTAYDSSYKLYITYHKSSVDMATPHKLIKMACVYLTASFAYAKINIGKAIKFKAGNLALTRDIEGYNRYLQMYYTTLDQIRDLVGIVSAEKLI